MKGCCELLPWDSNFFGFPVARIIPTELVSDFMPRILKWCNEKSVKCLYFLSAGSSQESIRVAQRFGFELVDIRVELNLKKRHAPRTEAIAAPIRPFEAADLPVLENIARRAHTDSRFFGDPRFPRAAAEELFTTWIRRDCGGFADKVWVALNPQKTPGGYLSCRFDSPSHIGRISLFAVSDDQKGGGVGKRLVHQALAWLAEQNAVEARVVTQARNIPAQRLYQACGFRTMDVKFWFHKWF
jgi:dTDP-4-amino-4,6-dideoxy-D-galactose acyltransferase